MPVQIARREQAKADIDRAVRKALAATSGKPRRKFLHLLDTVRGRSDLLRPARFRGRTDAGWLDAIVSGLLALNGHRRDWLRSVEAWRPEGSNPIPLFSSLAHHLLAEYPVPPVLLSGWFAGADRWGRWQQTWFKRAGRGQSLRSVGFPIRLTRRMAHEFALAPAHYPVGFALRWAQVRGLGGTDGLARAVAATRLGREFQYDAFWKSLVLFLINHPKLDPAQVEPAIEFLQDQKFEERRVIIGENTEVCLDAPQPDLSLKGWTVASLLRRVEAWQAQRRPKVLERRLIRWERSGFGDFEWHDESGRTWTIRELLDSDALAAEGQAMEHCAATYTTWCAQRLATIWSVGIEGPGGRERVLTVEVNPASREVVQAKAKGNADPEDQGRKVLEAWVAREGLKIES
jgi:hypothetical protein